MKATFQSTHLGNECLGCGILEGAAHRTGCKFLSDNKEIDVIVAEKGFDKDKLRLNIGAGNVRYSNCINMELEEATDVDCDIVGNIAKGLYFIKEDTFVEILFIHVIEHIERKYHDRVFGEIWRLLKPGGRLVLGFPDFIETAQRFMNNDYGARWRIYNNAIYGRQSREGDFHVTAMERQDVTDRMVANGFVDIKYLITGINVTMIAHKGEKLANL